jgi:hypothetical protein
MTFSPPREYEVTPKAGGLEPLGYGFDQDRPQHIQGRNITASQPQSQFNVACWGVPIQAHSSVKDAKRAVTICSFASGSSPSR